SLPNSRRKIESEIMRFMMQSSQIERKFNMLPLNHQSIFQILNLENDQSVDKSESFESKELQAFLNISKELVSSGVTGAKIYPRDFLPPIKKILYYQITFWTC
ncbi:6938_t:CDS:1, partial [Funneliformis caledonium]